MRFAVLALFATVTTATHHDIDGKKLEALADKMDAFHQKYEAFMKKEVGGPVQGFINEVGKNDMEFNKKAHVAERAFIKRGNDAKYG